MLGLESRPAKNNYEHALSFVTLHSACADTAPRGGCYVSSLIF